MVRILATLLRPDSGTCHLADSDLQAWTLVLHAGLSYRGM